MKQPDEKEIKIPNIPESDKTPLVVLLLGLLQKALGIIQSLKDEIARLKGHSQRPPIRPSQLPKTDDTADVNADAQTSDPADPNSANKPKRPGSNKRSKTRHLPIHHDVICKPSQPVPDGAEFKGYQDFTVQNIRIELNNIRYRREIWQLPEGGCLIGELPVAAQGHFGPELIHFILYQHYQNHVTQPLLLEQLQEMGIDISAGQINRILIENKGDFHQEKADVLAAGLATAEYAHTDDSGARHAGQNGFVTVIGNPFFAWFRSSNSKSRVNFLECLCAGRGVYSLTDEALAYMQATKLPAKPFALLSAQQGRVFADKAAWETALDQWGIESERHRRIATEGALFGTARQSGLANDPIILSDDAGQFDLGNNGGCWMHAERVFDRMIPVSEKQKMLITAVQTRIWKFYRALQAYKRAPTPQQKEFLWQQFDTDFAPIDDGYEQLNQALERFRANKEKLLRVLDHPDLPLHNNEAEGDIREYVKRRKISGGTRSELGRLARDTFVSLKKTARKLGLSFWDYLLDRVKGEGQIPSLGQIIRQRVEHQSA